MIKRDKAAEQRAVGAFQGNNKRLPDLNNPSERAAVYRLAYPPTAGGLPDELKSTVDQSLYSATGISSTTPQNPLSQTVEGSKLSQLQGNVETAKAEMQKTSQPNTALQVLQDAIRAKSGMGNQPIGENPLFKELGVTGIGALSQSIASQGAKMEGDFSNFSNIISKMSGTYKDMATTALNNYNQAYTAYKDESDRLQKITDEAQQHADAIEILNQQYANSLKLEAYKNSHLSVDETIKMRDAGLIQDGNGGYTNDVSGASAEQVANAIKQIESGGNYSARGASGEYGAYQFMPGTWQSWSRELQQATGEVPSATPENQDNVAKFKIQQWLNQGLTPQQIAAKWNSGSEVGWEDKVGTNSMGVKYDVPAYVKKFTNALGKTGSNSQISKSDQIAIDIFNGAKINVNDLPTKDRTAVATKLQSLAQEAKDKGDLVGYMRASAGGKDVSDATSVSLEKAINVIGQIDDLQKTIDKEATGPITGIIRSNNPYDKKAALIKAQLTAIVPTLARGVYGEVGVLTDNDIKQYSQTLPNLKSTEEISKLLLGATIRSVQRSIETKLKVQAGTGRDVSGLVDTYLAVKQQADSLLGGSSETSELDAIAQEIESGGGGTSGDDLMKAIMGQ